MVNKVIAKKIARAEIPQIHIPPLACNGSYVISDTDGNLYRIDVGSGTIGKLQWETTKKL